MTIETCSVFETANATSSVTGGLTDLIVQGGQALSSVLLVVATALSTAGAATTELTDTVERRIVEQAVATSTVSTMLTAEMTIRESAHAISAVELLSTALVANSAVASSIITGVPTSALTSLANATSTVAPNAAATRSVSTAAHATSTVFGFNDANLAATANATSTASVASTVALTCATGAAATSTVALINETTSLLNSAAAASSSASATFNGSVLLTSTAEAVSTLVVSLPRGAWVMNTETTAMTRFEGLPVASLARVGTLMLGLGDGGLYRYAGTTDAGTRIVSRVRTGRLDLRSPSIKRLDDVVMSYSCNGTMSLTVSTYGSTDDRRGQFEYEMPQRSADSVRGGRIKVGRNLASKFWRFEWANVDGSQFKVTGGTVDVALSNRRV
jgi:hypothetical protein